MDIREKTSFRFDFIIEPEKTLSTDKNSTTLQVKMIPDPRRYECIKKDDEEFLLDKFDHTIISKNDFIKSAKQLAGLPIYSNPPKIKEPSAYLNSRIDIIEKYLKTRTIEFQPVDKSDEFLNGLVSNKLNFAILSLDTVGSTKLANTLEPETYAFVTSLLAYEFSNIVQLYNGFVLKYTGDGLIGYFPEPSYLTMNDLAVDCATVLNELIIRIINPLFAQHNLPLIKIRTGIDSGEAYIQIIGNPSAKQHKDIIGNVVNLASKIQSRAIPGDIFLGEVAVRHLHTTWREKCTELKDLKDWFYNDTLGNPYKVFQIRHEE